MLYEMIGIVSRPIHCLNRLGNIGLEVCGRLLTRLAPLQVRPGNLAEVKEYAPLAPHPSGPMIKRNGTNERTNERTRPYPKKGE